MSAEQETEEDDFCIECGERRESAKPRGEEGTAPVLCDEHALAAANGEIDLDDDSDTYSVEVVDGLHVEATSEGFVQLRFDTDVQGEDARRAMQPEDAGSVIDALEEAVKTATEGGGR